MEDLRVTIKIELSDVKEFQKYIFGKIIAWKIFKVFSIFIIPFGLFGFYMNPKEFWVLGIVGLFYVFILFFWPKILINKRSKTNFVTQKGYESDIQYIFNDEVVHVIGNSFEGKMKWNTSYQCLELKNIFLLFQNKYTATIIPKRGLSEPTIANIRLWLQSKLELKIKK